jgi:hypothetical protein
VSSVSSAAPIARRKRGNWRSLPTATAIYPSAVADVSYGTLFGCALPQRVAATRVPAVGGAVIAAVVRRGRGGGAMRTPAGTGEPRPTDRRLAGSMRGWRRHPRPCPPTSAGRS